MGRHVYGMRGSSRNAGIAAGSLQPLARKPGIVAAMDQVMGNAGMIRLLFEQLIENGNCFPGVFIPVFLVGGRQQRQGIKYRGLMVFRITLVNLLHGLSIGGRTFLMIGSGIVTVESGHSINV